MTCADTEMTRNSWKSLIYQIRIATDEKRVGVAFTCRISGERTLGPDCRVKQKALGPSVSCRDEET